MLIAMQGVKLCAHCYTWSENLCSLLNHAGGKRNARSEAFCSLLCME